MFQQNNFKMKLNKKAQEEMVGFVVIMVLVSIILLIFLSFSIKTTPKDKNNEELANYLKSLKSVTTECVVFNPAKASVSELINYCQKKYKCNSGEDTCVYLNQTISNILNLTLNYGQNFKRKGFVFRSIYNNSAEISNLVYIKKGNCSSNYALAEDFDVLISGGSISTSIRDCY